MDQQTNAEELELRRKVFRKKTQRVIILFLCALTAYFAHRIVPGCLEENGVAENVVSLVENALEMTQSLCCIIGACCFASMLHSPLTPKEAEELERKETLEKTGEDFDSVEK